MPQLTDRGMAHEWTDRFTPFPAFDFPPHRLAHDRSHYEHAFCKLTPLEAADGDLAN
jgi:hypothetical protein